MRVTAVQCETFPLQEKLLNINTIVSTVRRIGSKNDLVVFPELSVTGYGGDPTTVTYRKRLRKEAEEIPGPSTRAIEKAAEETGCYVAFGIAERDRNPRVVYNSAVLVGPEGLVGRTAQDASHWRG